MQPSIDKAKGIIAKPMPQYWYDRKAIPSELADNESQAEINCIVDRKPYFMIYVYPTLKDQYTKYITNTKKKAVREFRKTLDELLATDREELTDEEQDFVRYFYARMPVGCSDCVMNKICRYFEEEFDDHVKRKSNLVPFDYNALKHGEEYSVRQYRQLAKLQKEYFARLQSWAAYTKRVRLDEDKKKAWHTLIRDEFNQMCHTISSSDIQLTDILLDICYKKESGRAFVWDMCTHTIVENLLEHNDYYIMCPYENEEGDVQYNGRSYDFESVKIGEEAIWQ